jgi:PhzF family phenazine biosynthesis protein
VATAAPEVLRYAAFTDDPAGGNPAGVVLDASGLDAAAMQATAAEVGFSETAFVRAPAAGGPLDVRYFSPRAEVPFCGHATIATGVAWAERHGGGTLELRTPAGPVRLEVAAAAGGGALTATLTSVAPRTVPVAGEDLAEALAALGWEPRELDPAIPPRVAFAGAWHLVLAAASAERLADLRYDFERLGRLMECRDWTTLQLVHRTGPASFRARNPFPPGGVVEDPATGAAAAALGGYLRELGLVAPPGRVTIAQGAEIGRPSLLTVDVPAGAATGIRVSGTAVPME